MLPVVSGGGLRHRGRGERLVSNDASRFRRGRFDIPTDIDHLGGMGKSLPVRSFAHIVVGGAVVLSALDCGGSSTTFPAVDASVDAQTLESSTSSGGGAASSSGGAASSGGGGEDGSPASIGDAGDLTDSGVPTSEASDSTDGAATEAASTADAGHGAADGGTSACSQVCASGCCDTSGICRGGTSLTVCGSAGASCADCSQNKSCPFTEAPCCKSMGGCGCAVGGLVGCN